MTDGILLAETQTDPLLKAYAAGHLRTFGGRLADADEWLARTGAGYAAS